MAFEFIGHAGAVAKQQQLWGMALLVAGAILAFYIFSKGKPGIYWLGVASLCLAGVYFLYQWTLLSANPGQWVIRSDETGIFWQSPNQSIDQSFTVELQTIDYIDRSAQLNPSDHRPVFHIILKNAEAIRLNPVSGIDLEALVADVSQRGIAVRETDNYYLPVEQRNK